VTFSESHDIETFKYNGEWVGDFLNPFVTYDKHTFHTTDYEFVSLHGETWDSLQRVQLKKNLDGQIYRRIAVFIGERFISYIHARQSSTVDNDKESFCQPWVVIVCKISTIDNLFNGE
jgi:hypothetical protein